MAIFLGMIVNSAPIPMEDIPVWLPTIIARSFIYPLCRENRESLLTTHFRLACLLILLASTIVPAFADQPARDTLIARGRLEPVSGVRSVGVYSTVTSVPLRSVDVAEGDHVEAGQLLATTRSAEAADAAVFVASAAVAVAERKLEQAHHPWREGNLSAARAAVATRVADFELAQRQLYRTEELVRSAVKSTSEQDQKRAEANRARAQMQEAEAQLAALTGVAGSEIRIAEAERDEAKARYQQALVDRQLSEVRAPIAGTVLRLLARTGDIVANRPILELADLSQLKVVAELEERLLPRVKAGMEAEVQLPSGGPRVKAEIVRISHQIRTLDRPAPDLLTGAGGRMVEMDLALPKDSGLPAIVGLELLVRIATH